jgi:hypothetical protein
MLLETSPRIAAAIFPPSTVVTAAVAMTSAVVKLSVALLDARRRRHACEYVRHYHIFGGEAAGRGR